MPSLDVIRGEDWAGLWVNDELAYQNHSINLVHVAQAVGDQTFTLKVHTASDELNEWLLEHGQFNDSDTVQEALNRGLDD